MWSDRISPERHRALVDQLHGILPAPRSGESTSTRLDVSASLEEVAGLLRNMPGFVYLNGSSGARLLHSPLLTFSYDAGTCVVTGPTGSTTLHAPAFDVLDAIIGAYLNRSGSGLSDPLLAGFLSYDLAEELEDLGPAPKANFAFPQFHLALYDLALVLDSGGWTLTWSNAWHDAWSPADIEKFLGAAPDFALMIPPSNLPRRARAEIVSSPDREAFEASVGRIVDRIRQGDFFQTNLCRCLETRLDHLNEWELFQRMRSVSPAQYEAFVQLNHMKREDGAALFSVSPEMFLKVNDRVVESSPIKGTRPRGPTPQEDLALVCELQSSAKDRAELAMIVDVTRNDLGRVCETGSVKVLEHASLMTLPTLHHLFSTVQGRLRTGTTPVDLLRAAFPAASITGAPKIEAMRIAMREEAQPRGPCMGAIGWMDAHNLEMSVAIRTAFSSNGRVRYYAGCGITADSVPSDEFAESAHKAAAFVRAIGE